MSNKVIVVDDHKLVCTAIGNMVRSFDDFEVTYELHSGLELLNFLKNKENHPDLILLDINMPIMDGYESMKELNLNYPDLKVLALSMNDKEDSYLTMIRLGAHGFVSKMAEEDELLEAICAVLERGCYYSPKVAESLFKEVQNSSKEIAIKSVNLTKREEELLTFVCTEMTYQQIADKMFLSPKTVDGYRNSLFQKLNAKSRVGLVVYAIKEGYYDVTGF